MSNYQQSVSTKLVKPFVSKPYKKWGEKPSPLDDWYDKMSSRYTVIILIFFTSLVFYFSYIKNPVTCWAPKHFTYSHTKYTNSLCWVNNTYYIPLEGTKLPSEDASKHFIFYYPYVPFILLTQAVMFCLPYYVWHGLNQQGGIDVDSIVIAANKLTNNLNPYLKKKILRLCVQQIDRLLKSRNPYG